MSREEGVSRVTKFDRPPIDPPITMRLIHRKTGVLQFVSHLDLQRAWQRALVRASIPMWYTQGFNPHSKIMFGVPLPVGAEGLEEMIDLRLDRAITCGEVMDQLNAELTDDLRVSEVYVPATSFSDIAFASYEIVGSTEGDPEANAESIRRLFCEETLPLLMTKRAKSGEKTVDIRPLIRSLDVQAEGDGTLVLRAVLRAGGSGNLNPESLVDAMRSVLGLFPKDGDARRVWYRILRLAFYDQEGVATGVHFR